MDCSFRGVLSFAQRRFKSKLGHTIEFVMLGR